jgi:hypothetical protein
LYTASGGSPTSTSTLRLQREPFGTVTWKKENYITYLYMLGHGQFFLIISIASSQNVTQWSFTTTRILLAWMCHPLPYLIKVELFLCHTRNSSPDFIHKQNIHLFLISEIALYIGSSWQAAT